MEKNLAFDGNAVFQREENAKTAETEKQKCMKIATSMHKAVALR